MKVGMGVTAMFTTDTPVDEQVRGMVLAAKTAEEAGFHSVTLGHHILSDAVSVLQCIPMMAALATELKDLPLFLSETVLPLYHPVDLAEQLVTLDGITEGRLLVGLLLGYRDIEYQALGLEKRHRAERFTESFSILQKLLDGQSVDHEGRHFHLKGIQLYNRPVQKPRPLLLIGAYSDPAIRRAARIGDGWMIGQFADRSEIKRQIQLYHQILQEERGDFRPTVVLGRKVFVGSNKREATQQAEEFALHGTWPHRTWGMGATLPEYQEKASSVDTIIEEKWLVGAPEDLTAQIDEYARLTGADHITLGIETPKNQPEVVAGKIKEVGKALFG